jgi:hypothetical protein
MKFDEFRMFVHGPFATNIYLDPQQVRKLKTTIARWPLSFTESRILKLLKLSNEQITGDQLIKKFKQESKIIPPDLWSALKDLEGSTPPYVERRKDSQKSAAAKLFRKNPKDSFSITEAGKLRLEETTKDKIHTDYSEEIDRNSEVDIVSDIEVSRAALKAFWEEIDAETSINSYRFLDQVFSNQGESFFSHEDRPVLLAIFTFQGFDRKLEPNSLEPDTPEVDLKFEKNIIYIYPSGVGIFSSQVTVRYSDDINRVKNKLESKVKKIIEEEFKKQKLEEKLRKFTNSISLEKRFKLVDIENFRVGLAKVSNPAWTHIVYWFYGNKFLEDDVKECKQALKCDFHRDFTTLLEQRPENMLFVQDHLVFYGWGRSLILTEKSDEDTEKWVRNKVSLVEVGQYSCFGNMLLDYLLQRVLLKLTVEEPIVEQSDRELKSGIDFIDRVRPAVSVFLQEFQCGINTILHAGAPFLVKTLEGQWRLDKVEENIRNKLEALNNERLAREQSVNTQKQDRMNIISSAFTIMGIAGVTAAIVLLHPLDRMLEPGVKFWLFPAVDQVLFFILTTSAIIVLAIGIIFKWRDIKHWISSRRNSRKLLNGCQNDIISCCLNLAAQGQYNRENYYAEVGKIRRKAKDLFDRRKINRSQQAKIEKEIERYSPA